MKIKQVLSNENNSLCNMMQNKVKKGSYKKYLDIWTKGWVMVCDTCSGPAQNLEAKKASAWFLDLSKVKSQKHKLLLANKEVRAR